MEAAALVSLLPELERFLARFVDREFGGLVHGVALCDHLGVDQERGRHRKTEDR